jgi:cell shape-determining protein MreC
MKKYLLTTKVSSRHSSFKRKVITAILIVLVGLFLLYVVPQTLRFAVAVVWLPYDTVRTWVLESEQSLPVYLRERHELDSTIRQLEEELAAATGSDASFERLLRENEELRQLFGSLPESRLLARVVARPNQLPYDVIMIDRGANDGVILHAPVFTGQDQLIGVITNVLEKSAHATLVTTPGFLATAYVYGPNIFTTTEGMGSGVLRVRVPQGILLNEQDLVILPALDSGVFGVIDRVETSPTMPERYGYVIADTSLQSLRYVSIGREPITTNNFSEAQAVVADTTVRLLVVDVPPESLVTPETFPVATSTESGSEGRVSVDGINSTSTTTTP